MGVVSPPPDPHRRSLDNYIILNADEIAALMPLGTVHPTLVGEVIFAAGDATQSFVVVLDGKVDIVGAGLNGSSIITTHVAGQFLGELNLLVGQRPFVSAVVTEAGSVIVIPLPVFTDFLRATPELADLVFDEFMLRRSRLHRGSGTANVVIIGSGFSAEAMALRVFASRSHVPFQWIDLDRHPDPIGFLAQLGIDPAAVPVVITPASRLDQPTTVEFAHSLGLDHGPALTDVHDVVIVGLGPAGLAAAIVAVSEGLDVVCLEAVAVGGQAAASSRIENYLGFPNGISGKELTTSAALQAQRLGARLTSPSKVVGLRVADEHRVIQLEDGTEIASRTVVIASGARYRRLDVEDLARYEGAGVYYSTSKIETRLCAAQSVIVVGGGDSAGQAALALAQNCAAVTVLARRPNLPETMSQYLVTRIESHPRIHVRSGTEIRVITGVDAVESVVVENTITGERETLPCRAVFCFIGAVPTTEWLNGTVALDDKGFALTAGDLPANPIDGGLFGEFDPLPYETSLPGVFAVGDVRSHSVKRVANAVGEGSTVIHSILRTLDP